MKTDFAIILFAAVIAILMPASESCMKPCSKMMQKLCAKAHNSQELQTFENPCLLDNHNCLNPSNPFYKVSDGDCPSASQPQPQPGVVLGSYQTAPTGYTVGSVSSTVQSPQSNGVASSLGPVRFNNSVR